MRLTWLAAVLLCAAKSAAAFAINPKKIWCRQQTSIDIANTERNNVIKATVAPTATSDNCELGVPIFGSLFDTDPSQKTSHLPGVNEDDADGFNCQLENTRRILEGSAFIPSERLKREKTPLGIYDYAKILVNNACQIIGIAESMDGAPLVQGVNTFKGSPVQLLSRFIDGNLQELAGGPLFILLHDYCKKYGPIYKLAFGPKSFIVVSDPVIVKYILKENPLNYDKGILAEILKPIMGKGLIPADPETWKVRRKAILPGFHKAWLTAMVTLFADCNQPLITKLDAAADNGSTLNMETEFGSVSLDIIGRAVFNYDFGSVDKVSPVVKAVYRALQEAEYRSTSFIPYWNLPFANRYMKNLKDFEKNMSLLNSVLDDLIAKAIESQEKEDIEELETRDYSKMENPSLLRFLVDMRGEESTSVQLRDDLMTMLIAGHETTAAVLTWTFFELCQQPLLMARVQLEVDQALQGRNPEYDDIMKLPLLRLCLAETLRMYPEPPLLIRRALEDDVLPKGGAKSKTFIPKGTDIFMATWNIHRSEDFWVEPNKYDPDRFTRNYSNPSQPEWGGYKAGSSKLLYPNEVTSDFAFLPFGGGSRKCVGDQFAMMESCVTVALILQRYDLKLAIPPSSVGMKTGATIHTKNGLIVSAKKRTNFFYETALKDESFKITSAPSFSLDSVLTPIPRQYHMASPVLADIKFNASVGITSTDIKEESKCPFNRN